MASLPAASAAAVVLAMLVAAPAFAACPTPDTDLGVARIVEIDASGGPIFGALTSQARETRFLRPKEVVLTFDDGPIPGVTRSILDTLDRFCTKATFFSVGRMALAYPALTREVLARGHTLGTHTWSHPILTRLPAARAFDQIDSGFAAVALAAGAPIAPFFRFPGLSDSPALLDHLQRRGVAAFTVDVVSNDSYIADPGRLVARTLDLAHAQNGGILLFHDIKHVTARALPTILRELKTRGYSVVHMRPKTAYVPDERSVAAVRAYAQRTMHGHASPLLAASAGVSGSADPAPSPRDAVAGAPTALSGEPPVTPVAPQARNRLAKAHVSPGDAAAVAQQGLPVLAVASRSAGVAAAIHPERAKTEPAAASWSAGWRQRLQESGG